MKTKKERTIQAHLSIAKEYLTTGHIKRYTDCKLCIIHLSNRLSPFIPIHSCKGCPLADKHGMEGCNGMHTYPNGFELSGKRALFHLEIVEVLKKVDSKYFTKKGWNYDIFKDIRFKDELIVKFTDKEINKILEIKYNK